MIEKGTLSVKCHHNASTKYTGSKHISFSTILQNFMAGDTLDELI